MKRTKAWRIQKTWKKIKQRLKIVKVWSNASGSKHPLEDNPHYLHKWNLNCGCKMCHFYKHIGNSRARLKHQDKKLLTKYEDKK